MKFQTLSGSVYEINTDSKKIRRVSGNKQATNRQGQDGDWREYQSIQPDPIEVGKELLIVWMPDTPLLEETKEAMKAMHKPWVLPCTMTSTVMNVEK